MTAADVSRTGALPGRTITLAARDYFGGVAPLTLRVTRVTPGRGDPDWVVISGLRLDADGGEPEACTVAARLSALLTFLPEETTGPT